MGGLSTPTKGSTKLHSINRELQLIQRHLPFHHLHFHCTQREGKLRVTKREKREAAKLGQYFLTSQSSWVRPRTCLAILLIGPYNCELTFLTTWTQSDIDWSMKSDNSGS
ncbi:unnamed protein product [Prunus brigantina]